jgi:hypothetical protein
MDRRISADGTMERPGFGGGLALAFAYAAAATVLSRCQIELLPAVRIRA